MISEIHNDIIYDLYDKCHSNTLALYCLTLDNKYYPVGVDNRFMNIINHLNKELTPTEFKIKMNTMASVLLAYDIDHINDIGLKKGIDYDGFECKIERLSQHHNDIKTKGINSHYTDKFKLDDPDIVDVEYITIYRNSDLDKPIGYIANYNWFNNYYNISNIYLDKEIDHDKIINMYRILINETINSIKRKPSVEFLKAIRLNSLIDENLLLVLSEFGFRKIKEDLYQLST